MNMPRVGTTYYMKVGLPLRTISGTTAPTAFVEPNYKLQIIENSEDGPHFKITDPIYMGKPVNQFSDKLVLGMTFKEFIAFREIGLLR